MNIKFFFFVLLLSTIVFSACPDKDKFEPDSTISIENRSNEDLMYYFKIGSISTDTLLGDNPFSNPRQYQLGILRANSTETIADSWIKGFEINPNLPLFLFNKDSIDQLPWERIRKNYVILKRFDLNRRTLDSLNWRIIYP